ncbi:MAG: DUF3052 domain-containing protein [Candidatus Nanopelagicales bacterium]
MSEEAAALAARLGITKGATVQELGYDSDTEELMGEAIISGCGEDAVDGDYGGVVDLVLLWWRDGDGDLSDALLDATPSLVDDGVIWLLTPKFGQPGAVEPFDIAEAVSTAGLRRTTSLTLRGWSGTRLESR